MLEDAFRWFDRVVIDAPPVLSVSDALAIARYADRCCLVVREGGSDRRELKRAADLIRSSGGNLVGFVWNEASSRARGSNCRRPRRPRQPPRPWRSPAGCCGRPANPRNSLTIGATFA